MRLTIERMRTMVLAAGVLLVAGLVVFLAIGKWRNPFNRRDIPKRLGIDIKQEANGFTYTQSHGSHTLFKIHASKVFQLREGNAVLHDVQIELYGADGKSVDRIAGSEFEYDQKAGIAKAAGPVEITLMRPGEAPAIAPKAKPAGGPPKSGTIASVAHTAARGQVQVETSGLVFDQNSGVASTSQPLKFSMAQASGSAVGASYDSQAGTLVLDSVVRLNTMKGAAPVELQAAHAMFERGDQECMLTSTVARYQGGEAQAEKATILFRDDGSASQLDATDGFELTTATGGRLAAPTGSLDFDEHNQPRQGHLEGGVTIDSNRDGRTVHGTAPTMDLKFTREGALRSAHLERGVQIAVEEQSGAAADELRTTRDWRSPVADISFRDSGHGKVELAAIRGTGGVLVTGESQKGSGPKALSRMEADEVTGTFGANSALTAMTGTGHASIEQTTPAGTRQTTSGDKLVAHFAATSLAGSKGKRVDAQRGRSVASTQIQSATVEGNVVLVQQQAKKRGAPEPAALRATAERAVYDGAGERLHLTGNPRVEDGGLQLSANKVDLSQASADAFAVGDVKATWFGNGPEGSGGQTRSTIGVESSAFGGQGPAHAIANEAQLHQATGEATFRGNARLWQQADSISAPVIVLNRAQQTLAARSTSAAEPVRVILVGAAGTVRGKTGNSSAPSVIRVRGGDLKYSAADRRVVMHGGAEGSVVAVTEEATTTASEMELTLQPPGNHAGKDGAAGQVESMTARGHVVVSSQGRRGTGEQLVYASETEEYVLTGTAAAPPELTDPARGTVTGEALIFNSRDDSVRIEGGGRETRTETTAPK